MRGDEVGDLVTTMLEEWGDNLINYRDYLVHMGASYSTI